MIPKIVSITYVAAPEFFGYDPPYAEYPGEELSQDHLACLQLQQNICSFIVEIMKELSELQDCTSRQTCEKPEPCFSDCNIDIDDSLKKIKVELAKIRKGLDDQYRFSLRQEKFKYKSLCTVIDEISEISDSAHSIFLTVIDLFMKPQRIDWQSEEGAMGQAPFFSEGLVYPNLISKISAHSTKLNDLIVAFSVKIIKYNCICDDQLEQLDKKEKSKRRALLTLFINGLRSFTQVKETIDQLRSQQEQKKVRRDFRNEKEILSFFLLHLKAFKEGVPVRYLDDLAVKEGRSMVMRNLPLVFDGAGIRKSLSRNISLQGDSSYQTSIDCAQGFIHISSKLVFVVREHLNEFPGEENKTWAFLEEGGKFFYALSSYEGNGLPDDMNTPVFTLLVSKGLVIENHGEIPLDITSCMDKPNKRAIIFTNYDSQEVDKGLVELYGGKSNFLDISTIPSPLTPSAAPLSVEIKRVFSPSTVQFTNETSESEPIKFSPEVNKLFMYLAFLLAAAQMPGEGKYIAAILVSREGYVLDVSLNTHTDNRTFFHHAEINLLLKRNSGKVDIGARIYTTLKPCSCCAERLRYAFQSNPEHASVIYGLFDPGGNARKTVLDDDKAVFEEQCLPVSNSIKTLIELETLGQTTAAGLLSTEPALAAFKQIQEEAIYSIYEALESRDKNLKKAAKNIVSFLEKGLDQMKKERIMPNTITYNAAISACKKGSNWKKAVELLREAQEEGVFKRSVIDHCCRTAFLTCSIC